MTKEDFSQGKSESCLPPSAFVTVIRDDNGRKVDHKGIERGLVIGPIKRIARTCARGNVSILPFRIRKSTI